MSYRKYLMPSDISPSELFKAVELSTNLAEVGTEAVSRRSVIDAVRAALLSWSFMPEWRDNKIIEAVEQLPPIQPEPKRGKWIIKDDTERFIAQCNCCRYIEDSRRIKNFCPNCGAKMKAR